MQISEWNAPLARGPPGDAMLLTPCARIQAKPMIEDCMHYQPHIPHQARGPPDPRARYEYPLEDVNHTTSSLFSGKAERHPVLHR